VGVSAVTGLGCSPAQSVPPVHSAAYDLVEQVERSRNHPMHPVGATMEASAATPGRIFISYRRDEAAYPAGWLFDRLAEHFGSDQVFKDVDSIEPGDDFIEVINTAVGSCDVLLALIGTQWLSLRDEDGNRRIDDPNDFVRLEIEAALARKVRVIPILVDGATVPQQEDLPPSIAKLFRHQALELSPSRFGFDSGRLLRVLDKTIAERHAQPPPTATPDPNASTARAAAKARPGRPAPAPPAAIGTPARSEVAGHRPFRVPWWLLGLAALVAIVLVAVALRPRPQPSLTLPGTANQPVAQVVAALRQLGLATRTTLEPNESLLTGRVIRTEPTAGTRLHRGAAVTLFVSSGPRITALPPRILAAGKITVGYVDQFSSSRDPLAPLLFRDQATGHLQGLDYDLAKEMGKRLGVQVSFTPLPHYTNSLDLREEKVDVSMSVLRDITPPRDVDFIDYLRNTTVLYVPKRTAGALRSPDDLCGRTVVRPLEIPSGSLRTYSDHCQSVGRPRIALMTCPTLPGTQGPEEDHFAALPRCPPGADPLQLVGGSISAAMADRPLAERAMETTPSIRQHLQVSPIRMNSGPFAIVVPEDEGELRDALRSALRAIIADGSYDRILSKWRLTAYALR
jgi:ABC-type amino acid transport substrate-binding protein